MNLITEIDRIKNIMGLKPDYYAGQDIPTFLKNWEENFKNSTLIWFDSETTNLTPEGDQITELAGIATNYEFEEIGKFHEKMKLDLSQISDLEKTRKEILPMTRHGEPKSTKRKYLDEAETIVEFFKWVNSFTKPVLIAQNASFDLNFLDIRYDKRVKENDELKQLIDTFFSYPVVDTKKIIEMFFIPAIQQLNDENDSEAKEILNSIPLSNKLPSSSMGKIVPSLKMSPEGWHSAIADVKMMIKMSEKIIDYLKSKKETDINKYQDIRMQTYKEKK